MTGTGMLRVGEGHAYPETLLLPIINSFFAEMEHVEPCPHVPCLRVRETLNSLRSLRGRVGDFN